MKTVAMVLATLALAATLPAQSFRVLHTFTDNPDGATPNAGLVLSGTTLYGTTANGGTSTYGTVFRTSTDGTGYVVLKSFSGSDGTAPTGPLVVDGATLYGAASQAPSAVKVLVFSLTTNGMGYAILTNVTFAKITAPSGGLVMDGPTLYGTAAGGSYSGTGGLYGDNVIFSLNTRNTGYAVIKDFGIPRGSWGGVTLSRPILYGSLLDGAAGGLFRVSTNGADYAQFKAFGGSDGRSPNGKLVLSGNDLFGTTLAGGAFDQGTIFKIGTNGSNHVILKTFPALVSGTNADGARPTRGLVLSGKTLLGVTSKGGSWSNGVVFRINTDGSGYALLKEFPPTVLQPQSGLYTNADGAKPAGDLAIEGGTLYGTTSSGGSAGKGVVFRLTVPPGIETGDGNFGVRTNRFGFTVTGLSNQVVIVEASTNLASTNWSTVLSKTLTNESDYFSDAAWRTYSSRAYRARTP